MITLKLVHKLHGVCAFQSITSDYTRKGIIHSWKMKYGRKFYDCEVIEEDDRPIKQREKFALKKVEHIPDGQIYDCMRKAAEATGVSPTMVNIHCNKWLKGNYRPYKFRFA